MAQSAVRSERSGITVLRVPGEGLLSRDDLATLANALEEAERDPKVGAVVLHGASATFCGGLDLAEFGDVDRLDDLASVLVRCFLSFALLRKPLVFSVDGLACGFGATMLCHADVVVASERSRIRMPFLELGLIPEAGSTLLLGERIGHLDAFRLLCLSEEIDAHEGRRMGLITSVEPSGEVETRSLLLARRLARLPADLLTTTRCLMRPERRDLAERIRLEVTMCLERLRDPAIRRRLIRLSAKHPKPTSQTTAA